MNEYCQVNFGRLVFFCAFSMLVLRCCSRELYIHFRLPHMYTDRRPQLYQLTHLSAHSVHLCCDLECFPLAGFICAGEELSNRYLSSGRQLCVMISHSSFLEAEPIVGMGTDPRPYPRFLIWEPTRVTTCT